MNSYSYPRSERIHSIQQHFHRVQSPYRLLRHHLWLFQGYTARLLHIVKCMAHVLNEFYLYILLLLVSF